MSRSEEIKVNLSAVARTPKRRVLKPREKDSMFFSLPSGTLIHTEAHYPIYVVNDEVWLDGKSGTYVYPWHAHVHFGDSCNIRW